MLGSLFESGDRVGFVCLVAVLALLACAEPEPTRVAEGREPALLEALIGDDVAAQEAALAEIEAAQDDRFIAPLIELVRAGQLGIAGRQAYNQRIVSLERLAGQSLGGDWYGWAEWYGGTELGAPPGFASWKGRLLAPLDPSYPDLLTDDAPARLRVAEIDWGGVPIDGIPPLEHPPHVSADQADHMQDEEPVFGVTIGAESRAYPLRILDWHELANDTLGGKPFSLVYCTLCGSGIAYDARVPGREEPLDFGTSGFLYRSNKLMYDRATRTLWNQLTGRPVLGPLAAEEIELDMLPAVVATWGEWRARHPETTVLTLDTGHQRPYRLGEPYGAYFASREKLFPVYESRAELRPKERVFGLWRDGAAHAWPLGLLIEEKLRNDTLGDMPIVLLATSGRIEVEGTNEQAGPVRYDAGGSVRAYQTPAPGFRLGPDAATLLDDEGRRWKLTEAALEGPDGARAPRIPGTLAYWFAWQGFHPETELTLPEE